MVSQTIPCLDRAIRVVSSGTIILGISIGHQHYVIETCLEFAKGGQGLCDELASLDDPQSGMLILRYCHTNRINHLARSVYPTLLKLGTRFHDQLTKATFRQLVCCHYIGEQQWLQATLPIRNGGFGMSSMVSTCPIAFVSSWARSLAHFPRSFGDLTDLVKNISRAVQSPGHNGSIASHLLQALPGNKSLVELISNAKSYSKSQNRSKRITLCPLFSQTHYLSAQLLGSGRYKDLQQAHDLTQYLLLRSLHQNPAIFA